MGIFDMLEKRKKREGSGRATLEEAEVREEVRRVISKLSSATPHLGIPLAQVRIYLTEEVPIAGVTKKLELLLNPKVISNLDSRAIATILAHEMMHVLSFDIYRIEDLYAGADEEEKELIKELYNIVSDAYNNTLLLADMTLFPEVFDSRVITEGKVVANGVNTKGVTMDNLGEVLREFFKASSIKIKDEEKFEKFIEEVKNNYMKYNKETIVAEILDLIERGEIGQKGRYKLNKLETRGIVKITDEDIRGGFCSLPPLEIDEWEHYGDIIIDIRDSKTVKEIKERLLTKKIKINGKVYILNIPEGGESYPFNGDFQGEIIDLRKSKEGTNKLEKTHGSEKGRGAEEEGLSGKENEKTALDSFSGSGKEGEAEIREPNEEELERLKKILERKRAFAKKLEEAIQEGVRKAGGREKVARNFATIEGDLDTEREIKDKKLLNEGDEEFYKEVEEALEEFKKGNRHEGLEALKRAIVGNLVGAVFGSTMAGLGAGNILREIDSALTGFKGSWRDEFITLASNLVTRLVKSTWAKPVYHNPFQMGKQYLKYPNVYVAVDTSASIDDEELKMFIGDVIELVRQVAEGVGKTTVIFWDDGIRKIVEIDPLRGDDIEEKISEIKKAKGGGGTRPKEALEYIKERAELGDLVVFLTDGFFYGSDKEYEPLAGEILEKVQKAMLITTGRKVEWEGWTVLEATGKHYT